MSKKISSSVKSEEKSASLLGGSFGDRSDSYKPSATPASGFDEDRNKPVPNSAVPSTRLRKAGNKDVFENVFISEQQLETSLGTFCNMSIADGLITLFQTNGVFMEDFPFATVESYKTLDRPLCMFVLAQNKSGGGRNAIVQHKFRSSMVRTTFLHMMTDTSNLYILPPRPYMEIYNSMKTHYNAWHAPPSPTLDKKNNTPRTMQPGGQWVVSSDLMRDKAPEAPASPLKPEHRLLFATEEQPPLIAPEPPAQAAAPKRKAVRTVHSKAAAAAAAAAAPAPAPPPEPTEEELVRAAIAEYLASAKQRDAQAALISKWGRSAYLHEAAARMLSDPNWQVKMKVLSLFETMLQTPNAALLQVLEDHRTVIREQLNSPQLSLRERAQKVLSLLGDNTQAVSGMFSGLAVSPTAPTPAAPAPSPVFYSAPAPYSPHNSSSVATAPQAPGGAYTSPTYVAPVNAHSQPKPAAPPTVTPARSASQTPSHAPRKNVVRHVGGAGAGAAPAPSADPERFLLDNWNPVAALPSQAPPPAPQGGSVFDFVVAAGTPAAPPASVPASAFGFMATDAAPGGVTPAPADSTPSSAFDFLN